MPLVRASVKYFTQWTGERAEELLCSFSAHRDSAGLIRSPEMTDRTRRTPYAEAHRPHPIRLFADRRAQRLQLAADTAADRVHPARREREMLDIERDIDSATVAPMPSCCGRCGSTTRRARTRAGDIAKYYTSLVSSLGRRDGFAWSKFVLIEPRVLPEPECDWKWIDVELLPPSGLRASRSSSPAIPTSVNRA